MFEFIVNKKNSSILKHGFKSSGSRSSSGRLTMVSRSGFQLKTNYRYVDYFRKGKKVSVLLRLDFDSFRAKYLGLMYSFGFGLVYFGLSSGWKIGSYIKDNNLDIFGPGSSIRIGYLPSGTMVNNIHSRVTKSSTFVRAIGTKALLVSNDGSFGVVCKLPSGKLKRFSRYSHCIIGDVLNRFVEFKGFSKTGFHRNRGYRPKVRGVAKNPVDHPHGGGEGKKSPPAASRSPWGWLN